MPGGARAVVLLTGGTGFIGEACLRRLAHEDVDIHAISRRGEGPLPERVRWRAGNLTSPESVSEIVAQIRPTHLLQVAWIATPGVYLESVENLSWLEAGLALARAFGEAGGLRAVGVGSCAEYDWSWDSFVEDVTPLAPASLYGRCKVAMAAGLQAYAKAFGFSAAWGRIFFPYGPGDAPERLIFSVIEALAAGRELETSDGAQARDFIHVRDVADLLVRLLFSDDAEGAYNIATGDGVAIRSVITELALMLGGLTQVRFGARRAQTAEPARLVADMEKVHKKLRWRPEIALKDGLAECVKLSNLSSGDALGKP